VKIGIRHDITFTDFGIMAALVTSKWQCHWGFKVLLHNRSIKECMNVYLGNLSTEIKIETWRPRKIMFPDSRIILVAWNVNLEYLLVVLNHVWITLL